MKLKMQAALTNTRKMAHYWKILLVFSLLTTIKSISGTTENQLDNDATTSVPLVMHTFRTVPKIPDGHKQYQFYNLDSKGNLIKQWLSLQEVQNIILAYATSRHSLGIPLDYKPSYLPSFESVTLGNDEKGAQPAWNLNPLTSYDDTSIDEVLANVQKVMSNEMSNAYHQTYTSTEVSTPEYTGQAAQNITIPDTILAYLIEDQVSSLQDKSPWGLISQNRVSGVAENQMISTASFTTDAEVTANENYVTDTDHVTETTLYDVSNSKHHATNLASDKPQHTNMVEDYQAEYATPYPTEETTQHSSSIPSGETTENFDSVFTGTSMFPVTDVTQNPYDHDILYVTEFAGNDVDPTPDVDNYEMSPGTLSFFTADVPQTTTQKTSPSYSIIPVTQLLGDSNLQNDQSLTTKFTKFRASTTARTIEPIESATNIILYPVQPPENSKKNSTNTGKLSSKSSVNVYNSKAKPKPAGTNVLTALEMAQISPEAAGNLGTLEKRIDYTEFEYGDAEYEYDDAPLYLEDISEINYQYENVHQLTKNDDSNVQKPLDFPSPDPTDSYHRPDHINDGAIADVDPTQYLPSHNPAIANRENPLRKTPHGNKGLDETVANLDPEVKKYVDEMNSIAFKVYKEALKIHRRQNLVMSPLNLISSLSMLLLGARGSTGAALSELLKTDQFLRFNPHLVLKNVTNSVLDLNNIGHEISFVNNIFIEKPTRKYYSLDFISRTMKLFYNALVMQVPSEDIGSSARDEANQEVRQQTLGTVRNFLKPNASLKVFGPLSVVSSGYFQGNWKADIHEGDLIDMNFIRFPSAERRLIRTVGMSKRMRLNAGYSEELDATVAEIPLKSTSGEISMLLVMPGQQKSFVANGLLQLEQSLTPERWSKLLKCVIPHTLNFKMPIFSHRNYLNLSGILSHIGLEELFTDSADFSGINGVKNLYLGDAVQLTEFHSCKLDMNSMFGSRMVREKRGFKEEVDSVNIASLTDETNPNRETKPSQTKPKHEKQANVGKRLRSTDENSKGEEMRLKTNAESSNDDILQEREPRLDVGGSFRSGNTLSYDRAFMYCLRHNPTGLILFMGRYLDPETF